MLEFRKKMQIVAAGQGVLHRAVVAVPDHMVEESLYEERLVFFEVPPGGDRSAHLIALLALAWCTDTADWSERGIIYNIHSLYEMREDSLDPDDETGLYLFETGAGGEEGFGPRRIHYAKRHDVTVMVTPRVARRLDRVLDLLQLVRDGRDLVSAHLDLHAQRTDQPHVEMEAWNMLTDAQRAAALTAAKTAIAAEAMSYLTQGRAGNR